MSENLYKTNFNCDIAFGTSKSTAEHTHVRTYNTFFLDNFTYVTLLFFLCLVLFLLFFLIYKEINFYNQ